MIDPDWFVADLDPMTWREIGTFFDPGQYIRAAQPGERGLFILHEHNTVLRIVDSQVGVRRDIGLYTIDDPHACAQQLYARGEWQRVHIIDKAHLAAVARIAQQQPQRERTLDAYYAYVYQLIWGNPLGYVCVPEHSHHWHGWTYQGIKDVVTRLQVPSSLALGVFDGNQLIIGLILVCAGGQIRRVTTFEALELQSTRLRLSATTLELLSHMLTETIAPPAGILLCSRETFEMWVQREDKMHVLLDAHEQNLAYWRWSAY